MSTTNDSAPMSSKQRLLTAIDNKQPDRLPVTTHHLMPYFLNKYMGGASNQAFFEHFGLDPIVWTVPVIPDASRGEYADEQHPEWIMSDHWRIEAEELSDPQYKTRRLTIHTPKGDLTCVLQYNEHTMWLTEHIIKQDTDLALIAEYMTMPVLDVAEVNRQAEAAGEHTLVRGHIPCFDFFGQPGCWQDASCLMGIEPLIMKTFTDPEWVHELLGVLKRRKLAYVQSLKGAKYDILELGGGDASSTVISPTLLETFVAPYDKALIDAAHKAGQRIAYHTCGGMMPILEQLADMGPDALETFTPVDMGGDIRLDEAKRRIGDRVCMIGGFDQGHFFQGCTPEKTREAVRRCFDQAGAGGGFILSPSDHFFDADPALIEAFADEARKCVY